MDLESLGESEGLEEGVDFVEPFFFSSSFFMILAKIEFGAFHSKRLIIGLSHNLKHFDISCLVDDLLCVPVIVLVWLP